MDCAAVSAISLLVTDAGFPLLSPSSPIRNLSLASSYSFRHLEVSGLLYLC
jgi:hypothetical protein